MNFALARTDCVDLLNGCTGRRSSSSSAGSGSSSRIKINPAAVPTEKYLGVEGIFYQGDVDLSLVRGTGRVGAALSPTNSESTFFGPPATEIPDEYLERRVEKRKYKGQKYNLATAFNLIDKKGSSWRRFSLNLGLMAKYNTLIRNVYPGAGLSGVFGPFTFGYSAYQDETLLDYERYYGVGYVPAKQNVKFNVSTYNIGLFLSSLTLDYSQLKWGQENFDEKFIIDVYTASLTAGHFIFTLSRRIEESPLPDFDEETKTLDYSKRIKYATFGGVQVLVGKHLIVGAFYNYYLLNEYSANVTLFF